MKTTYPALSKAGRRGFFYTLLLVLTVTSSAFGQSYYVHRPDPRVYPHGHYNLGLHMAPGGGLLLSLGAGFFNHLQVNVSYGGGNIIGSGPINWYPLPPGVHIKFAILDELQSPLSLAIGFDSQNPVGSVGREVNPAGIYLVAGKKFEAGWTAFDLALGGGYDLMTNDTWHLYTVSDVWLGEAFHFGPELTVYPARNNTAARVLNLGFSFKWEIFKGTSADFLLADLLNSFNEGWTRSLRFQITQEF